MLTVRIPKEMESELNEIAKHLHLSKSEVVKQAITMYINQNSKSPYEAGKDLFGCDDSSIVNGSTTFKQRVRRKINEKHTH